MKRAMFALSICCSACADKSATELRMTTEAQGDECRVTIDGQTFVTTRLENDALTEWLSQLGRQKVVLRFPPDTPYRCVGSAIITLQRANANFRVPQVPPFSLALVYLGLGDRPRAIGYLEQAYAADSQWLGWLAKDHVFDPLRSEPRFVALLRKLGLGLE